MKRVMVAGVAGTAAMTGWMRAAPMMGVPPMNIGVFSGSALLAGGSLMGHLLYGVVVGGVYARGGAHGVVTHAVHA